MKKSSVFLSMLIFSLTFFLQITPFCVMAQRRNDRFIESTCKNTPYFNLCVSTLRSNPKSSKAADVADLGLIIVDAMKTKAREALNTINKLRSKYPLRDCVLSYNTVVKADIPEAVEALSFGDPKFAEDGMADAAIEAEGCEKSFKQFKSPISELNKAVHDLSVVARAIIRMLL